MLQFKDICAIGDSHTGCFYPYCKICGMGPVTMYSLTTDKLQEYVNYLLNTTQEISKNNWWLFCVGEIDVRCLFYKQIYEYHRNEDEVIDTLVNNYIRNIQSINHDKIILCTTVPPVKIAGNEDKLHNTINSQYPFQGSDNDRHRWSMKLNLALTQKYLSNSIKYVDLYNLFADPFGFIDTQYTDSDLVHVAHNHDIIRALNVLNLY